MRLGLIVFLVSCVCASAQMGVRSPAVVSVATKQLSANSTCGQADDLFQDCWDTSAAVDSNWTSKTDASSHLTLDTGVTYGGSAKALKLTFSDNTAAFVQKDLAANQTTNWLRFYVYFGKTNWTSDDLMQFQLVKDASDNNCFYVTVASEATRIRYMTFYYKVDADAWQSSAADFIPMENTWYAIKVASCAGAGGTGTLQAWIDATQVVNLSSLNWNTFASWRKMQCGAFGGTVSAAGYTVYFDNFQWRTNSSF